MLEKNRVQLLFFLGVPTSVCAIQTVGKADYTNTILKGTVSQRVKTACTLPDAKKAYEGPKAGAGLRFAGGTPGQGDRATWKTDWKVGDAHGLTLTKTSLGSRFFSKRMDLDSYYVGYSKDPSRGIGRQKSRLICVNVERTKDRNGRYDKIKATFVDKDDCLFIMQTFAFGPLVKDPEPSHLTVLPSAISSPHYWAAYMYPRASYEYRGKYSGNPLGRFEFAAIMQNFNFRSSPGPDPASTYRGHFFIDNEVGRIPKYMVPRVIYKQFDASNTWFKVIENGQTLSSRLVELDYRYQPYIPENFPVEERSKTTKGMKWRPDNFHQTYEGEIDEPDAFPPGPGCANCVHTHWRWPTAALMYKMFEYLFKESGSKKEKEAMADFLHAIEKYSSGNIPGAAIVSKQSATAASIGFGQDVYVGSYGIKDFKYFSVGKLPSDEFFRHPVFYSPVKGGVFTSK